MSAFLTISQVTAIKYAYKSIKQVQDNPTEIDREDLEESLMDLERAFPDLNLEFTNEY